MAEGGTPNRTDLGARGALVVAVDPDRRDAYERHLTDAGISSELFEDAKAAERRVAEDLPDVLVLDRGLPGLALFRLYSRFRGLSGGGDVPIFFVGEPGEDTPTDRYLGAESSPGAVVESIGAYLGVPSVAVPVAPDPPAPATIGDSPPPVPLLLTPGLVPGPTLGDADADPTAPTAEPLTRDASATGPSGPAETEPVPGAGVGPVAHASVAPASGAGVAPDEGGMERSPVPVTPASSVSRLDIVLLRLGLLFLLLGGAVLLLRPDAATQPIAPPNLPTASPATPRTPAPSPSPAGAVPVAPVASTGAGAAAATGVAGSGTVVAGVDARVMTLSHVGGVVG